MNITEYTGKWQVIDGYIVNRKTGEQKRVKNIPSGGHYLAGISADRFIRECEIAFTSGVWPEMNSRLC